jgi:hypothetical protein
MADTLIASRSSGEDIVFKTTIGGVLTEAFRIAANGTITNINISSSLFGNGLVTTPSISFTSDSNTGLYRVGEGSVGFSANGVLVGSHSSTGAWTLGPSGFTGTNTINGSINIPGAGSFYAPASNLPYIGGQQTNLMLSTTGSGDIYLSGGAYNDGTWRNGIVNRAGSSFSAQSTSTLSGTAFFFQSQQNYSSPAGTSIPFVNIATATASGTWIFGANSSTARNLIVNGTAATAAAHLGGGGLVPVGSIVAYNPGYYTNASNGGFTTTGPAGNSVAQINTFINAAGWYVCDGAALNNVSSPIWNAAGRNLPNLTDSRFLMGSISAGATGGGSTVLAANQIPTLTSTGTVTNTGTTVGPVNTGTQSAFHTHPVTGNTNTDGNHPHTISDPGHNHTATIFGGPNTGFANNTTGLVRGGGSVQPSNFGTAEGNTVTGTGISVSNTGSDHSHGISFNSSTESVSHTHTIPSLTVNSGQSVSVAYTNGSPQPVDTIPKYLSTYFIIRAF